MSILSSEQLLHAHQWRYATKKFDPTKKIGPNELATLEKTLLLSPSSFGLQPWKFLIVTNPEIRAKLLPASWGQVQIVESSHLVIFTVLKHLTTEYVDSYIASISATRHQPIDSPSLAGLRKVILDFIPARPNLEWNARQAYIALGNLMTTAALMEIDSCPMEGIDSKAYDEILGLNQTEFTTVVVCPLGYRVSDDKYATAPKVRFPASQLIQHI